MWLVAIELDSADIDHFYHTELYMGQCWSSCSHLRDGYIPRPQPHFLPGKKTGGLLDPFPPLTLKDSPPPSIEDLSLECACPLLSTTSLL